MSNDNTEAVDKAVQNLESIKSGQDPRSKTETTDSPSTTSRPSLNDGRHALEERRVRDYLMEWYEDTEEEFDIDWSDVTIIVTGRMTKAHGRARHIRSEDRFELKISKHAYDNEDWEETQETIRHEAIHIWQYQELGEGGHGQSFKKWADKFGCVQYADNPAKDPKYTILCENCGEVGSRQRACKVTKQTYRYSCGSCNGDLSVRQNH